MDDAADPQAYGAAVERWARSTWETYRHLHPLGREWINKRRPAAGLPRSPGAVGEGRAMSPT